MLLLQFFRETSNVSFLCRSEIPEVAQHMEKYEISFDMILSKWFICLFCDILPIETVFRIWDILMLGNSAVIIRAAYMSILWHKSTILKTKDIAKIKVPNGVIEFEVLKINTNQKNQLSKSVF